MKTASIAVLLLVCGLHACAPVLAASDDAIAAGRAALERNDAEQAIAQLEKATAAQPASFEAHYYLGNAYGRKAAAGGLFGAMSMASKAKDEWTRASQLKPDSVDARLRLIEFYTMAPGVMGGSESKALEQAAEIRKRDALEGHRAYAHFYSLQKKFDLAVKEMTEAVRAEPKSARAHYFLGNAFLGAEDWKASLQAYETVVALDPGYMPGYFRIGHNAAKSQTNYARGEDALRKYVAYKPVENEPGLGSAWYWLGVIQEKQGRKAEALKSYLNAQKIAPDIRELPEALKRVQG